VSIALSSILLPDDLLKVQSLFAGQLGAASQNIVELLRGHLEHRSQLPLTDAIVAKPSQGFCDQFLAPFRHSKLFSRVYSVYEAHGLPFFVLFLCNKYLHPCAMQDESTKDKYVVDVLILTPATPLSTLALYVYNVFSEGGLRWSKKIKGSKIC
jgi:hypothetical protein